MTGNLKTIHIQYYAQLREKRRLSSETRRTSVSTPLQLYQELDRQYSFQLPAHALKVAVNHQFKTWEEQLRDNDLVVFLPVMSGG